MKTHLAAAAFAAALVGSLAFAGGAQASTPASAGGLSAPQHRVAPQAGSATEDASALSVILNGGHRDRDHHDWRRHDRHHDRHERHRDYRHGDRHDRHDQVGRRRPPVSHGRDHHHR